MVLIYSTTNQNPELRYLFRFGKSILFITSFWIVSPLFQRSRLLSIHAILIKELVMVLPISKHQATFTIGTIP